MEGCLARQRDHDEQSLAARDGAEEVDPLGASTVALLLQEFEHVFVGIVGALRP